MSEDRLVKVILTIRDGLTTIVEQLNDVLKEMAPELDPEELMRHEWKGRKTGEGQYAKGNVSWGWDWRDEFSPSVIKTLEGGPLQIDQYEFTLTDRIVQAKKIKKSNPHEKMNRSLRNIHRAAKRMGVEK